MTVRTLHHWNEVGLVSPGARSPAAHRLPSDADLQRLQQVLAHRELGLPLDQVARLLDDPAVDAGDHLRRQHALLRERISRLQRRVAAVQREMGHGAWGSP